MHQQPQQMGYLCHPQQRFTLRRCTLDEGRARGVPIIEVVTAGGLQLDILPCAGLDIAQARFRGVNVAFISKNGYDNPAVILPYETEFLNTFSGGMLYTCGLRSTGGAHRDQGEWHPLHGRYHSLQAEQVAAYVEDDVIIIRGIVRETALFGHCLEVKRSIRIPIDGADVTVEDELTNHAFAPEEYALLYHCNFGWPFVSKDAELLLPTHRRTTPRTPFAATGLGQECSFTEPIAGEEERVFFHEDMAHTATVQNRALGISMTMTWSDSLPILAQWRSMAAGDYVLGLEPTNCYIMGRKQERENGTLPLLQSGETITTRLHFHFDHIAAKEETFQ